MQNMDKYASCPVVHSRLESGIICIVILLLVSGCRGDSGQQLSDAYLRMNIDKAGAGRLVRYYFGGYVEPEARDPLKQGLVVQKGGSYYVNLDSMVSYHPQVARQMRAASGGNALTWEELVPVIQETYYEARGVPEALQQLRNETSYPGDEQEWFSVEIDGVMTTARRHVYVPIAALRYALQHYHENDKQLLYPVGTTMIGDHVQEGKRLETTVMRKRADGFWDFFTYGPDGGLVSRTQTPPRELKSPTQCVGCHFGSKLFDPEESYPAEAHPGPRGPRRLHVGDAMRDAVVARFFQEHRKRSDMVLGLYNTLFVAKLRAEKRSGDLSPKDEALLSSLEIPSSSG